MGERSGRHGFMLSDRAAIPNHTKLHVIRITLCFSYLERPGVPLRFVKLYLRLQLGINRLDYFSLLLSTWNIASSTPQHHLFNTLLAKSMDVWFHQALLHPSGWLPSDRYYYTPGRATGRHLEGWHSTAWYPEGWHSTAWHPEGRHPLS